MHKKVLWLLTVFLLAWLHRADAQQSRNLPRLAILSVRSPGPLEIFDAFHQGLRDLGYVQGKNITIEYRFADDNYHRLPALMAELISFRPDVIFTHTTPGAMAAKQATSTIPSWSELLAILLKVESSRVSLGLAEILQEMTFVTLELAR